MTFFREYLEFMKEVFFLLAAPLLDILSMSSFLTVLKY